MNHLSNFYELVLFFAFTLPLSMAPAMLPDEHPAPLKPSTWVKFTLVWFSAFALSAISPDRWGWAIVFGSILVGEGLIAAMVGIYRLGKRAR